MKIKSFAKINLGLEIIRKRPDGYHDIKTLFQWISLADTLELREVAPPGIVLEGNDPSIPWDENNLIYKAAALLRDRYGAGQTPARGDFFIDADADPSAGAVTIS